MEAFKSIDVYRVSQTESWNTRFLMNLQTLINLGECQQNSLCVRAPS